MESDKNTRKTYTVTDIPRWHVKTLVNENIVLTKTDHKVEINEKYHNNTK